MFIETLSLGGKDGDIGADIVIKPFTDHSLEGETNYVITFIEKELNFDKGTRSS